MIIVVYDKNGDILKQCTVSDEETAIANAGEHSYIEIEDCTISDCAHIIKDGKAILRPKHKLVPDVRKMIRDEDMKRHEIFQMPEEDFKKLPIEEALLKLWQSGRPG